MPGVASTWWQTTHLWHSSFSAAVPRLMHIVFCSSSKTNSYSIIFAQGGKDGRGVGRPGTLRREGRIYTRNPLLSSLLLSSPLRRSLSPISLFHEIFRHARQKFAAASAAAAAANFLVPSQTKASGRDPSTGRSRAECLSARRSEKECAKCIWLDGSSVNTGPPHGLMQERFRLGKTARRVGI